MPTKITCEADVSGSYATRHRDCGAPATMAFLTRTYDGKDRAEGRCGKHAGAIKRMRYAQGTLIDLTPDVIETIAARRADEKARRDAERAAKREQDAIRTEAARVAAREADAVVWIATRADEQALDGWDGASPVYREVPRWVVRAEGAEQTWDDVEVKVQERDGFPATLEVRHPSRMTPRQAIALAEALIAAASRDECDGFRGGNAWGVCAACGRSLDDHQ